MRKFLFLFLVILASGLPAAMIAGTFPMGRAKARPLEEGAALALAAEYGCVTGCWGGQGRLRRRYQ